MTDVREIPLSSAATKTRFWASQEVQKAIRKLDGNRRNKLLRRLRRYSTNGFWNYDYDDHCPIRYERNRVYRIGCDNDLFRILGFYDNGKTKQDFIAIDAYIKTGQKLTMPQDERINKVAAIRGKQEYRKVK